MKNTVDAFYILYVLSSGIIDDMEPCLKILSGDEWKHLPI